MKGSSDLFFSNFNSAQSSDVKIVNTINSIDTTINKNKVPTKSIPNSMTKIIKNGVTITERYYDENGDVYLDIDYVDHGNRGTHPEVPHQHKWINNNGDYIRKPAEGIK